MLVTIKNNILAGKSLYQSFKMHFHFNAITCELIKIGEQTGTLEITLHRLLFHLDKTIKIRKRLKQALFYPCIVLSIATAVTGIMFFVVIPHFQTIVTDMTTDLPLLTRVIFFIATLFRQYGHYFIFFIIISSFYQYYGNNHINILNKILNRLPFYRYFIRKIILARFTRTMALCLDAGLPILETLRLLRKLDQRQWYQAMLHQIQTGMSTGMPLSYVLQNQALFSVMLIHLIKTGEETGRLDAMLNNVADNLEEEIETLLFYLNQLLDPLIMVGVGVLIGGLVIGIYLPIFKLGSLL